MLSSSEPNIKQPELLEQKPIAPPASTVFATLLPRWQKVADDYRELTDRLQTEKSAMLQSAKPRKRNVEAQR